MKIVKDWLLELPAPYRSCAIKNHEGYKCPEECKSLSGALIMAFKWSSTPEGKMYWENVHRMSCSGMYVDIEHLSKAQYKRKISSVKPKKLKPVKIKEIRVAKMVKVKKKKPVKPVKQKRVSKSTKIMMLVKGNYQIRYVRTDKSLKSEPKIKGKEYENIDEALESLFKKE